MLSWRNMSNLLKIQELIKDKTNNKIDNFIPTINGKIDKELKPIGEELVKSLGKNIKINLPKIDLINETLDIQDKEFNINEKDRKRRRRREQKSVWGWVKRTVDFFDNNWGYDEYTEKYTTYEINKKDILTNSKRAIDNLKKELSKSMDSNFNKKVTIPINNTIQKFVIEVERLRASKEDVLKKRETEEVDTIEKISSVKKDIYFIKKQFKRIESAKNKIVEVR